MAELLPACNSVIFDEAHQLPENRPRSFFGETLSTGQLIELARGTFAAEALSAAKGHARSAAASPPRWTRRPGICGPRACPAKPPASPRHRSGEKARIFRCAHRARFPALRSACAALDALSERSEGSCALLRARRADGAGLARTLARRHSRRSGCAGSRCSVTPFA